MPVTVTDVLLLLLSKAAAAAASTAAKESIIGLKQNLEALSSEEPRPSSVVMKQVLRTCNPDPSWWSAQWRIPRRRDSVAFVGPSGAGKTTLVRALKLRLAGREIESTADEAEHYLNLDGRFVLARDFPGLHAHRNIAPQSISDRPPRVLTIVLANGILSSVGESGLRRGYKNYKSRSEFRRAGLAEELEWLRSFRDDLANARSASTRTIDSVVVAASKADLWLGHRDKFWSNPDTVYLGNDEYRTTIADIAGLVGSSKKPVIVPVSGRFHGLEGFSPTPQFSEEVTDVSIRLFLTVLTDVFNGASAFSRLASG